MTLSLIPWAMLVARALLGPTILLAALYGATGRWLGGFVLAALLSDIYDGILARRWGCETPSLRLADSTADTIFYLGVAATILVRKPLLLRANWKLLLILFVLEALCYAFDWWKFRKGASYHSYLAKCWGLVMAATIIGVLCFDRLRWMVPISLALGIAANIEGLAMSSMLPSWQHDVKTLSAAARLRCKLLAEAAALQNSQGSR